MTNYRLLIKRLDAFIRKYYANRLIRGGILVLASALAFYLIVSVGEYFFYFPSWLRYSVLAIFIVLGAFALIRYVILPLLQMSKLGPIISHERAAGIIGEHFPNVRDKLLNILQLSEQSNENASKALIEASIEQKTKELSPVPFVGAVDLRKNRRMLPLLLGPLIIGSILLFAAPYIFEDSALRLLNPSKSFAPPAPFEFELETKKLSVPQFEDITVKVRTEGRLTPEQVSIMYNGQRISMEQVKPGHFSHTIHKIAKNTRFSFESSGYNSERHEIKVLSNPIIKEFQVMVDYPSYTGKKDEILDNIGDVVIPQGTALNWRFKTEHTDRMMFGLGKYYYRSMRKSGDIFSAGKAFMSDTSYSIAMANQDVIGKDTLKYRVSVIPDQYPSINVSQYIDSMTGDYVLFVGEAGDDYLVKSVSMQYTISNRGRKRSGRIPMKIKKGNAIQFDYFLDIMKLGVRPGEKLQYHFTACDNDAVNGSKCVQSSTYTFTRPSAAQQENQLKEDQKEVTEDLKEASEENEKVEKEIKKIQEDLLEKKKLDWSDQQNLKQLSNRNQSIQKQIENIQRKFQKNNKKTEDKNYSEQLQQKQENLEQLMEELKDNKLEERMKKLEELMKMLNKDELFEQLEELKQENMQMEKDIERMVELMKQLERDMRAEDLQKKVEDLANKEEDLQYKNEEDMATTPEMKKEQDELNKEMEEVKKDLEELEKVNEETEQKKDMEGIKEDQKDAEEDMKESSDKLSKGEKSKAGKSQKSAKSNLQDMAAKLGKMAGGGDMEKIEIDIKATRQILSNLIRMSFGQENLMDVVKKTRFTDPKHLKNIQKQHKLSDDSKMIADSLFALSKRVFTISSTVNKEIAEINAKMENSIRNLESKNIRGAGVNQQYVMTGTNNLALMLNELLQQLQAQQAQAQAQQGSGSCSKPGNKPGKKPGKGKGQGIGMQLSDVISKQQQLGKAMEQMLSKMNGKKPGDKKGEGKDGKKPGGKKGKEGQSGQGGQGEQSGGNSEQMAKVAAQQSALRKQLNDIQQELIRNGQAVPELQKIQSDMDRNETEIVNKRITQQLLARQSNILSRLLKAKDAMREQDQGEERESNQAQATSREVPQELRDILQSKKSAIEYYKTVPASLKPYYKGLVEQYFGLIE